MLACDSDSSGRTEVYLVPFGSDGGAPWRVSADGGLAPRWPSDGSELFFVSADGWLTAMALDQRSERAPTASARHVAEAFYLLGRVAWREGRLEEAIDRPHSPQSPTSQPSSQAGIGSRSTGSSTVIS